MRRGACAHPRTAAVSRIASGRRAIVRRTKHVSGQGPAAPRSQIISARHATSATVARLECRCDSCTRRTRKQLRDGDVPPGDRRHNRLKVTNVRRYHRRSFGKSLRRDQDVAVKRVGCRCDHPSTPKSRPELCSRAPSRRRHRNVGQLAGELIESVQAAVGFDTQQLTPELVVCNFGDQDFVVEDGAGHPAANVGVLSWMADLAEHGGVEQQPHEPDGSGAAEGEENVVRSTWSTSHSGSADTSSAAQRSNMAATRAACSARMISNRQSCGLGGQCSERIPAAAEDLQLGHGDHRDGVLSPRCLSQSRSCARRLGKRNAHVIGHQASGRKPVVLRDHLAPPFAVTVTTRSIEPVFALTRVVR